MSDDDLKAFKIGDTQRPTVASSASSRKAAPEESPDPLARDPAEEEKEPKDQSEDSPDSKAQTY